jgi:hypothetical protein
MNYDRVRETVGELAATSVHRGCYRVIAMQQLGVELCNRAMGDFPIVVVPTRSQLMKAELLDSDEVHLIRGWTTVRETDVYAARCSADIFGIRNDFAARAF